MKRTKKTRWYVTTIGNDETETTEYYTKKQAMDDIRAMARTAEHTIAWVLKNAVSLMSAKEYNAIEAE